MARHLSLLTLAMLMSHGAVQATGESCSSLGAAHATDEACVNTTTKFEVSFNQVAKNPRRVEYRGDSHFDSKLHGVSQEEWQGRVELASLGRIMHIYGFDDQAAQCIMARVSDEPDAMLMNEWGFFWEETTASSLVKVYFGQGTPAEGEVIDATTGERRPSLPDVVNIGCVPVGRSIFEARPDVNVVVHAHPHSVMAVASTESGLQPLSQAAMFLYGTIGRYKYDFSYGNDFEDAIADQFREGKRAVMLDHHGLYAAGKDAREAWFVLFHLNQACEVQIKAQSTGQPLKMPSDMDLKQQYLDMISSPDYAYDGSREWAGCIRKLNRELPGYEL